MVAGRALLPPFPPLSSLFVSVPQGCTGIWTSRPTRSSSTGGLRRCCPRTPRWSCCAPSSSSSFGSTTGSCASSERVTASGPPSSVSTCPEQDPAWGMVRGAWWLRAQAVGGDRPAWSPSSTRCFQKGWLVSVTTEGIINTSRRLAVRQVSFEAFLHICEVCNL